MAERGGFEPPIRGYRMPDFESGTFNQLCHLSVLRRGFYQQVGEHAATSRHAILNSKTPCHRHTDEGQYPAKQKARAADKTAVVSLREADNHMDTDLRRYDGRDELRIATPRIHISVLHRRGRFEFSGDEHTRHDQT